MLIIKKQMNFDNLLIRYGDYHIVFKQPHCLECKEIVEDGILYNNKCGDCYDKEYSGCYGGGCRKD